MLVAMELGMLVAVVTEPRSIVIEHGTRNVDGRSYRATFHHGNQLVSEGEEKRRRALDTPNSPPFLETLTSLIANRGV